VLTFGTGGLRGLMPHQMNVATVHLATEALANYLPNKQQGVVIGYDSRHNSALFAEEAARVLAAHNIPVFLTADMRPTPLVSFACRHLKAQAGIMITASHNPKEYNGYKVYWDDGAQIVAPHDLGIMEAMQRVSNGVPLVSANHPLITRIGKEIDNAYLSAIPTFSPPKTSLKICYSSLHGVGHTLLPAALQKCGFSSPLPVPSQCIPDGDFPTTPSPNPEDPAALTAGIQFLEKEKGDILFVTDPDADRVAVVILADRKPVILNGHQLAALATYYLFQSPTPAHLILTTLVTTPLLDLLANAYNKQIIRTPTGFKYIGEQMRLHPESAFLFGAEESLGYLPSTHCRDKDGIASACLFAHIAASLKAEGKTLLDLLHEIYDRFGFFQEKTLSLNYPLDKMDALITRLKNSHPIDHAHAGTLEWKFDSDARIMIRPSGTEPKIKAYLSVRNTALSACEEELSHLAQLVHKWLY